MHVKKGDTVLVIAGNDKGKTGVVKEAMPSETKVLVEGINLRWKHKKPSQQNPKGERVQRETPIHASNVKRVEGDAAAAKKKSAKAAKPAPVAKEAAATEVAAPKKAAAKKAKPTTSKEKS
ncbi:MAG: 50S ribosomal protein L24 [Planctomycetes bacterium]|nr:50S ribosomal protein L24 [Planctomycetota bacterium]